MAKKKDPENSENTPKEESKKGDNKGEKPIASTIIPTAIVGEMRDSYLDYAMSVIASRALPDVRDGLKPVHRRILYAMHELGVTHAGRYKKSAAIVGDVLGKYHPHGDTAVYDAMVKMAQDFSSRYPLVQGQGNFGSIDGDPPAAMRYCLTGDTLLPTDRGMLRVDDIVSEKNNNEQNIDISVLSKDKKVHTASKWFDSGVHPTKKIKTAKGFTLQGTHNHPILVWTVNKETNAPVFAWKLLGDIQKGDVAVIDRNADTLWSRDEHALAQYAPTDCNPRTEVKTLPKTLNADLAHILGALVSEGNINEKKIEFCNSDTEWIALFSEKWKKVFPDTRLHIFQKEPSSYGKKPYTRIEIHSLYIIAFLRNLGLAPVKSAEKDIPHAIFKSPKHVVSAFLQSYFEGDGSVSNSGKMNELAAISASEILIQQLQTLLLRFGIVGTKRFDTHRNTHKLYLRGLKSYTLFKKEINFAFSRKQQKLEAVINGITKDTTQTDRVPFVSSYVRTHMSGTYEERRFVEKHNFDQMHNMQERYETVLEAVAPEVRPHTREIFEHLIQYNYLFDPIEEVEESGEQRVYSIRVDSDCHSFVGNGFINHNTEARMNRLSTEMLRDIEKETVDWRANYDGTRKEPESLPAAIPHLILNGTLGIAVGMATSIPPHNLREILGAVIHLIENEKATTEDLLAFVTGPDYPTGGIVFGKDDIHQAYASGRGGVVSRGEADIVETKQGQYQIVITSTPYRVNKADLVMKIADLVRDKKLEGIKGLRDESTKDTRVVIDIKTGAQPQRILNYLYKHTELEHTFNFNMVALVDGVPQTLSLKGILEQFILHRKDVVLRRSKHDLRKAEERAHILEGLKKALDHIDKVIQVIKKSKDTPTAHKNLMKEFKFSERQATAILEMRLQKLAGLERKQVENELKEKKELIAYLKDLIKYPEKILAVVKEELEDIKEKYGDDRKTKVVASHAKTLSPEDLVEQKESMLVLTKGGYIKRTDPTEYRKQKRGGVGVVDMNTKDEDFVTTFLTANTHDDLLFFTDKGKAYQLKMYELPEGKRATKGKSIMNFLQLSDDESVTNVLAMPKDAKEAKNWSLFMVTKSGVAKKVASESFFDVRRSGIIAIKLSSDDELFSAVFVQKGDEVVLASRKGQAIRFKESDIRQMGRTAGGVKAMTIKKGDEIVGAGVAKKDVKDSFVLVMSDNGHGKQTKVKEYKVQKRGGSGIKTVKLTEKTGDLVSAKVVTPDDQEIVAISKKGQVIRTDIKDIPALGRQTQGVRIMKLKEGDKIASLVAF